MSHLSIFALGPLRIELDGQPVQTSRHKALALLVYLAMQPEKHARQALSAFLWPEYEQEKAYAYLRRTLWELHNLLGKGWLEADREQISLNPDADILLDITKFQDYLSACKRHNHPAGAICPECAANLHKAALLYRGDFLSGFGLRDSASFDDWQFFQQEALRRDYAEALKKLVNLLFQEQSFNETLTFARRWLALDTLNEEAHRVLMKTYALSGQRHAALRQFQECQRILQTDLGIAPEPATTILHEMIAADKYNLEHAFPQKQPQDVFEAGLIANRLRDTISDQENRPAHNLPTPPTSFIGRQQELDQITDLLADPDCWLLTLLGPGGIGKTRLAIEAGWKHLEQLPQGVYFVPLSTVDAEQAIAPAMARAMRLSFRQNGPKPEQQLLDFLREKRLLIILDSFEGLVQWASVLTRIHSQASGVKMLVTSRHRLLLKSEWVMELKGLDYPPAQSEAAETGKSAQAYGAVELFLQVAHRVQVMLQPTPQDLSAISRITQLLEGMPLGLELAATWVNTLSCQEILHEINQSLDFLETSLGDVSERQRSIRAVFDHSWNLLNSREQVLLPRLSVFRGSFPRQAAEQVAGISLRELAALVNQSLVRRTPQGWFDLHDLLRQYSVEKLEQLPADSQETHRRHCAYYCARLSEWNRQLHKERQGLALHEIEAELENLLAAWHWAISQGRFDFLEQAVDGLCMFYMRRARFAEGLEICQKASHTIQNTASQENPELRLRLSARLLTWQAALSMNLECFEEAEQYLQECRKILENLQQVDAERVFALVIQTLLANLSYESPAIFEYYNQASQLSQMTEGREPGFLIFFWRFLMGGGSVSKELYLQMEKRLANVRQSGDPFELGCYLFVLGIAELFHFYRMEKAEPLLRESIVNFHLVDDPATQAMRFMTLGYLLLVQGKFEENLALKRRELEIAQDAGDRRMIGIAHAEIGEIYCHLGNYHQAEDEIRTGIALVQGRSAYEYALRHRYLGDVLLAQGKLNEAREAYQFSYDFFQTRNEKGWMFTALTGLSRVEFALGERSAAWLHAKGALHLYNETSLYNFFAYHTVAEIALLLADQGEIVRALELYSLVSRQSYLAQSRWFADLFGKLFEEFASSLPTEERSTARERGQALDFSGTVEMLLKNYPKN